MKHRVILFSLLLLAMLHAVPLRAQGDGIVTQLQFGRQTVTVPTEGELVFYDFKGTDQISSVNANNQHSLTVFKPAVEGMSVQVTFESIDIRNDGASYPGKVIVYSGDPDPDNAFAWATGISGVTNSTLMPDGEVLATLDGEYGNLTYHSTADDGSLGVGVLWRYAKACDGWVAKVKCVKLTDMQVTGASSDYENIPLSPRSRADVALAHVSVDAEGVLNADRLTGVSFTLPVNDGVVDPMALRLYSGGREGLKGLTPLDANVSQEGAGYRFTLDYPLGSGGNCFTIGADILSTAKVSAKVKVEIEGVMTAAHAEGVSPFIKAEGVEISNPAIVCMVPGPQSIYVDETPLSFYDDGGPDGKAASKFSGTTTFVPSAEGKKVQIDFSKVAVANGSIYYQYVNVYNGAEPTAENLVMRVANGATPLIHSTSTDGALTVEMGDNGTTQTGDGFEATVSLFEPEPMVLEGIAMTGVSEESVRAGATAQQMAMVNIRTANTEPSLTLDAFKMSAEGTPGAVKNACLVTAAGTPTVIATAMENNGEVNFSPAQPYGLKEGDNIFMVLVDVGDRVVNDDAVALTFTSAILGGTVHNGNGESVSRKVFNRLVSDTGTQDVTIQGRWEVSNKPSEYSYYGYDDIAGDQIMIIRPGEDGAYVQLNFSKLEIKFPGYYGTSPTFKVLNGAGTGGTVLFEATKTNQSGQVGKDIRSTDSSGALTILFNTKGNRGTSTSNGFVATAVPYKMQPMAVKSAMASQITDDIYGGDTDEEILKLSIVTEGGESPLSIEELVVDLKGCEMFVRNVKLISSGTNSEYVQPVTLVASAPAAASVTLRPADGTGVLAENENHYWLAFDMVEKLPDNREVDAKIVSMKIGGDNIAVTDPDPEGARTTRNIYKFHGEDTVMVDEPLLFYDNGGPSAYYTREYSGAVVFKPVDPTKSVRMHFNSFKTGYNDELYVYNGSGTEEANQLIKLYGDKAQPRDLASSAADGALTARFRAGSYGLTDDGWEILVETFTPQPLALETMTSVAASPAQVYGGSQNNVMLHVQVDVKGERGDFNLKGAMFDVSDTSAGAISAARLWSTGTEPTFLGAVQFGETVEPSDEASTLSFAGEYNFPHAGTYHFWLTYDVASGLEAGTQLKASLKSVTLENETIESASEVTAVTTVRTGMHGDYIIGVSDKADYKTFAAAIRDLSNTGVDGPVNMLIEDGTYEEAFTFGAVPGASGINRVVFRSENGNRDKVAITYGEAGKALSQGVVNFSDGASHITLQSVTVTSPAKKCDGLVTLAGGCLYDTIDDCVIKGNTGVLYEDRVVLVYTTYLEQSDKNCNHFTLSNSRLEGGYYGLSATGITNLNYPMMIHDVTVIGNTFVNQSSKALQAMGVNGGLVIRGNKFINDGSAMAAGYRNMDLYRCTGDVVVADNLVDLNVGLMYNSSNWVESSDAEGIYIRDISSARPSHKLIYNNDIHLKGEEGTSHTLHGIYVYDNDPTIQSADIIYNTIVLSGAAGKYSSACMISAKMTGSTIVNNVFQNRAGGTLLRGTLQAPLSEMTIADNALHTTGATWVMTPTDHNSIEAAVEAVGQPLGIAEQADFLAEDMHELKSAGRLMTAKPHVSVSTDLLGNPRHATTPTMGAYEYTDQSGMPSWCDGYPKVDGVTISSAVLNLCADKASTARYVVKEADSAIPSDADFDDCEPVAIHTNRPMTVSIGELSENCDYKVYVKLVSYLGVENPEIATVDFTTLSSAPVYPNPVATILTKDVTTGLQGESVVLRGAGSGGMEPLAYKWTDQTGSVLSTTADVTAELTHSMTYRFTVTDSRGKEAFEEINIEVRGNQYVATFEDLALQSESHWGGNTTNLPFYSGSFAFDYYHDVSAGTEYWGHFSYANLTSTTYSDMSDQYNNAVGTGADGSDTYGVAYVDSYVGATYLTVTNKTEGDKIAGMWLTNSAWVMDAIRNGDGLSSVPGGFAKDDYFKVSITGLLNASQTGTVDFYLADFRAENETDRYALDTWQWVDLSSLGEVNKLWFRLESTKRNAFGMTTPQYFCLDNVGEGCPWVDVAEQVVTIVDNADGTLDLNPLFGFAQGEGAIAYTVEAPEGIAALGDSDNGLVKIDGATGGYSEDPFILTAKGTQRGRSSYLRIPVRLDYKANPSGLDDLAVEEVKVYPIPAHDVLNISTGLTDYTAELFDTQGALVLAEENLSGASQLELPGLMPGVYLLRVRHLSGSSVIRIVVK